MTKYLLGGGALALLAIALSWQSLFAPPDPDVISRSGLHWHPQLAIYVKGEEIEIPENIGIGSVFVGKPGYGDGGMAMTPMHTHDDIPLIHLEYGKAVRRDDITLGKFFEVWGKDMRGFGTNMHMTVNGETNAEYENYVMHDGDRIELRYE